MTPQDIKKSLDNLKKTQEYLTTMAECMQEIVKLIEEHREFLDREIEKL